ncbi:MAG: response regulator [Desulfobacterales bacterium]|nr:response regulator [Desulfobacterales bacterium]
MTRADPPTKVSILVALLEQWTRPPAETRDDPLRYWQERVLLTALFASVAFGLFAYVPSMWLSIKEGLWLVALADTLIYALMLAVFVRRDLPYVVRSGSLVGVSYLLGLVLLVVLGPIGAGPVWLFAFPVFAGLLMGFRASLVALVINAVTLVATGLLIWTGIMPWSTPVENPIAKWLVSGVNFMLLDTVTAICITVILTGLRTLLQQEKTLRASVETKHRDLEDAHRRLGQEIRDRQAASDLLKESQGRLKAILDSVNTGILIVDARSLEIVDVNPAAAAMMGARQETALGRSYHDYIIETATPLAVRSVDSPREGNEADLVSEDGTRRPIMINMVPVHLNHRLHLLASFLDIAKLRKAEEDRLRLETELSQSRKMEAVGTLAGGIAHDFNNILAAVIGFTELAMDEAVGNTALENNLEEVLRAGERAKNLVRQILAFSRQDECRLQPLILGNTVDETMRLMRATIPATVTIDARVESRAAVMADSTQMHQIVMNLCTNAWHAMDEDRGVLEVGLAEHTGQLPTLDGLPALPPGHYLHLWVRDTGVGMVPDTARRIFEPFFTTKEAGHGTGMGLSVVHGIVKSHSGGISVESVPGEGTTFHIYLPVVPAIEEEPPDGDPEPLRGGRERILLVDDEPRVTEVHCKSLQGLGYHVAVDHDGIAALDRLTTDPAAFDLVISDMAMPGMAGDQLMQAVHALRPDLPVILCTGYSRRFDLKDLKAIGAAAAVLKPLARGELARLVRSVLDGPAPDLSPEFHNQQKSASGK